MNAVDIVRRAVLIAAIVVTCMSLLLVAGAWKNDRTIDGDKAQTQAEVLSAGKLRSAVRFVTPDRVTHTPRLGVLYPTNLVAGQRIEVEYARSNPDLVRVKGRDVRVAVIPAASLIVVAWVLAFPVLWYLRRRRTQSFA